MFEKSIARNITLRSNAYGCTFPSEYLFNMDVGEANWHATVRFQGQDHFGLDVEDIKKKMFNQFQFFRAWFVLQRYTRFAFRPFLTNMEAIVDIKGGTQ